jgi:fructuronate reductase
MDGSQKLPQRLLGTIRDRLCAGATIDHLSLAVAGWMRYASGRDEQGRAIEVADPLASRFAAISAAAGSDPAALTQGFLALGEVFGTDLPREQRFTATVTGWLDLLLTRGARATVADCVRTA